MYFELSVTIAKPPCDVFRFLLLKDEYQQAADSPVLALDKLTPGECDVGTRYREVVRMTPVHLAEVYSVVTRCDPPRHLEEDFSGPGPMSGHLAYEFIGAGDATTLVQRETLHVDGLLRLASPLIRLALAPRLRRRLEGIKADLESGWEPKPHQP